MPDPLHVQHYRERARYLRNQAAQTPWQDLREQMLETARAYEILAESVEQHRGPSWLRPSN
jgi:hypothetical protein